MQQSTGAPRARLGASAPQQHLARVVGLLPAPAQAPRHRQHHRARKAVLLLAPPAAAAQVVVEAAVATRAEPLRQQAPQEQRRPTGTAPQQWLEQAVPALVRHLSQNARSHNHHHQSAEEQHNGTWLQIVRTAPPQPHHPHHPHPRQGVSLEHRRLPDYSPATAAAVWHEVQGTLTSSGQDTIAVVLARPIPDPSHLCPLSAVPSTGPSSSSSCAPPAPAAASPQQATEDVLQGAGVVEMQGLVDLDGCCGGTTTADASQAAVAVCSSAAAWAGSSSSGAGSVAMRELARQVVASPAGAIAALGMHGDSSSSSSSSDDDTVKGGTGHAAAQQLATTTSHDTAHHHHHHHHHHDSTKPPELKSRSRRRFLRRQQRQQQERVAAAGSSSSVPETVYYGLAVQSLQQQQQQQGGEQQPSGCYVLKLSSNRDAGGCTCTVYTVTHVCKGQPLYQQMVSSWLAGSGSGAAVGGDGSASFAW